VCFVDQPDPDVPAVQPVAALTDPIDLRIATALVADGRSTLKALSEITGLSVSAVQARVRRLESGGVIRGYTALVDAESVGLPLAALIAITPLDPAQPDDAPERLAGLPEIEACHSVAGEDAYVLFVRVDRARGTDPRHPPAGKRLDPDHRRAADVLRTAGRAAGNRAVTVKFSLWTVAGRSYSDNLGV
jgi:Lrp/AsnC family transcriptional regulator, leucine-responsive regulatory protein